MELLLALLLAPLLTGTIRRVKAAVAGRVGPPWLQAYRDVWKLAHKSAIYPAPATWVFRAGPPVALACTAGALALAPAGSLGGLVGFPGDLVLLVALLALARFATALAALDTGSAFEGMGASRELAFAALAEPALLVALASLARSTGSPSLAGIAAGIRAETWLASGGLLLLASAALLGILLAENARIPFDDPTTHLELTMIHEAMVLDHGGPDLAAIELAASWKLWLFAGLLANVAVPVRSGRVALDALAHVAGVFAAGIAVGAVESSMARLRLARVPQMLVAIGLLALLSVLLAARSVAP
jgi:formate hydrogenlyase subunit 4